MRGLGAETCGRSFGQMGTWLLVSPGPLTNNSCSSFSTPLWWPKLWIKRRNKVPKSWLRPDSYQESLLKTSAKASVISNRWLVREGGGGWTHYVEETAKLWHLSPPSPILPPVSFYILVHRLGLEILSPGPRQTSGDKNPETKHPIGLFSINSTYIFFFTQGVVYFLSTVHLNNVIVRMLTVLINIKLNM